MIIEELVKNTENALTLGDSDSAREKTGICILTGTPGNLFQMAPGLLFIKHYLQHQSILLYPSGA